MPLDLQPGKLSQFAFIGWQLSHCSRTHDMSSFMTKMTTESTGDTPMALIQPTNIMTGSVGYRRPLNLDGSQGHGRNPKVRRRSTILSPLRMNDQLGVVTGIHR